MATVTLRDLHKSFGDVEIIKGVDLDIADREFVVFVGPSGCGKSTLLRMIAGLEEITSGDLAIDGERVNDVPPAERGLAMVFTLINLPIVVWMLYTFFKEVPKDILEAGRMDGAKPKQELVHLLMPLALPGIASTALLAIILAWNEAFWSLNLTSSNAAPLTAFIASFSAPEGLFWAKLSAASTVAIAPILVFGWMSQRQLVRGLTFGAVK